MSDQPVLPGVAIGTDAASPPEEWRILSMRQPWLWAVLYLSKRVENRRQRWSHCGPLLLHEAVGCKPDEYDEAVAFMERAGLASNDPAKRLPLLPLFTELPRRGGIVARCRIAGRYEKDGAAFTTKVTGGTETTLPGTSPLIDMRWHMKGEQYGYLLEEVAPTIFVPFRGMLGLLHAPPELVRAALGAAP